MSKNASKNASKTDNPQRFYLMLPPLEEAGDFPDRLADALDRADVACVLAPLVARDEGSAKKIVKALIAVTEPRGVALLIDDAAIVARSGADGAHVRVTGETLESFDRRHRNPEARPHRRCRRPEGQTRCDGRG